MSTCYFAGLLKHPPHVPGLRAITFFTEATCLFPHASQYVTEFRLEVWSCRTKTWQLLDRRPYFPIEADGKESRLHRIGYFYQRNRTVLRALDAWIVARYPDVEPPNAEPIGGVRVVKVVRPTPAAGGSIPRYEYRPLVPIEPDERREVYWTTANERKARCSTTD